VEGYITSPTVILCLADVHQFRRFTVLTRLLPHQIGVNWEIIKFAAVNSHEMKKSDWPLYFNRLLASLMANEAQVFFRTKEDLITVLAVEITRIVMDEVTGEKSLFLDCLYSYQIAPRQEWQDNIDFIVSFAKQEGCKKVTGYSTHRRVDEIMKDVGFKERFKGFIMEV
jgi:hypothetical protein